MATTLIINPGSSSKKYALYKDAAPSMTLKFERVGDDFALCTEQAGGSQNCVKIAQDEFNGSTRYTITALIKAGVIESPKEIARVGIRVVAPGTFFQQHALINDFYLSELKSKQTAAPLHIPHTLREIYAIKRELPEAVLAAASDSAFHHTLSAEARNYSIDPADAQLFDIYRFGYHGLSVSSIACRVHAVVGTDPARMLVAHVGSGVSVTALKDGVSVDTSMGFAPGSGLVMASRAGDIESGAVIEIMRAKHLQYQDMYAYLQTHGGLLGMTGENDLRQILQRRAQGDTAATAAFSLYAYHIKKSIGSYMAALGGLDCIVLTATAVERNPELRALLLSGLECFGVQLDLEKNDDLVNKEGVITVPDSPVKVAVMRTNEMGEMYRAVNELELVTVAQ